MIKKLTIIGTRLQNMETVALNRLTHPKKFTR